MIKVISIWALPAGMGEDEHEALFSIAEATQFFRSFFTKLLNRPL